MEDLDKKIEDKIKKYLGSNAFTARKLTDTPTDALEVVNRKFVTLNGPTANRPTSSILGQRFYDTTINKPVYWNGVTWKDSAGSNA